MDLHVNVTTRPDAVVVALTGELDLAAADRLLDAVGDVDRHAACVIVDMSGVRFCDSSGMRWLLQLRRKVTDRGADFYVTGTQGIVAEALSLTGIAEILHSPPPDRWDHPAR